MTRLAAFRDLAASLGLAAAPDAFGWGAVGGPAGRSCVLVVLLAEPPFVVRMAAAAVRGPLWRTLLASWPCRAEPRFALPMARPPCACPTAAGPSMCAVSGRGPPLPITGAVVAGVAIGAIGLLPQLCALALSRAWFWSSPAQNQGDRTHRS